MKQNENIYTNVARFFVHNKQLSLLLVLVSFVFGYLAYEHTPKQYDPEITLPAFRIITSFPGATAEEVEVLVTNEIENKLSELAGIDDITSQSIGGGTSMVNVIFKIGSSLDASKTQVIEKIQANLDLAPLGVSAPLIQQIDPENIPIMTVAITGKGHSSEELRAFALDLKDRLKTTEHVTNIQVTGGKRRQLNVIIDPIRLEGRNISTDTIIQALDANNVRVMSAGIETDARTIPVEIHGQVSRAGDIARIMVGGTPQNPVYLEDVAKIDDGYEIRESTTYLTKNVGDTTQRENAVYLSFAKAKGSNISTVTEAVHKKIEDLEEHFIPESITLTVTRDEGETAREEIAQLVRSLAIAIGIVSVTLFFFLGLRVSLVVATTIPLTIALVFIAGYLFDYSINRITLFALIFSLGLLVDDAIVVIENINRHFQHKGTDKEASIANATGEVGMGVFLSTVTAIVVFAPMGMVTGMMGAYMGPIAFFSPVARLLSLIIAFTLSPYIASVFLHRKKEEKGKGTEINSARFEVWYHALMVKILGNKKLQNNILIGTLIAVMMTFSFPVFEFIHFRMLPKADKAQFYVQLDLREDVAITQTHKETERAEAKLLSIESVESIETVIGTAPVADFNGLFRGSHMRTGEHQATLKVNLADASERGEKSEDIVVQARTLLVNEFAQDTEVRVKLVEDPPGPPVLSTFLLRIKGADEKMRDAILRDITHMMYDTTGIVDVDTSLPVNTTETKVSINRSALAVYGLTASEVSRAVQTALEGTPVGLAHFGTKEEVRIVVRYAKDARSKLIDLLHIPIQNSSGEIFSLAQVASAEPAELEPARTHNNRDQVTTVFAETEGRAIVYVAKDIIFKLLEYTLPNGGGELEEWSLFGFTYIDRVTREKYRIEWGGEFEMTLENFRDLGTAMLVAYLLIYIVLVAQFKSFRISLLIMSTIIMAFAGVISGFALLDLFFGTYFSATSMIGAIALGGIVVGNAILLLDFIEQGRARGESAEYAITEACRARVKPILLTSLTSVLGALVIVRDPVWGGLAWALFFGLTISTILTLVVFPVLYYRFGK